MYFMLRFIFMNSQPCHVDGFIRSQLIWINTVFNRACIWFYAVFKEFKHDTAQKGIRCLFFNTSKISLDKYIMIIGSAVAQW